MEIASEKNVLEIVNSLSDFEIRDKAGEFIGARMGRPEKAKKMYQAVLEGQEIAFRKIKDGADGQAIHQEITRYFDQNGFSTGEKDGRMQGFFHGTGHGVGLEVHEPPRISNAQCILKTGMVVTVEPGLYYLDAGGIRLEDVVAVGGVGVRNLTRSSKELEIS